jgi:hypothetical protein
MLLDSMNPSHSTNESKYYNTNAPKSAPNPIAAICHSISLHFNLGISNPCVAALEGCADAEGRLVATLALPGAKKLVDVRTVGTGSAMERVVVVVETLADDMVPLQDMEEWISVALADIEETTSVTRIVVVVSADEVMDAYGAVVGSGCDDECGTHDSVNVTDSCVTDLDAFSWHETADVVGVACIVVVSCIVEVSVVVDVTSPGIVRVQDLTNGIFVEKTFAMTPSSTGGGGSSGNLRWTPTSTEMDRFAAANTKGAGVPEPGASPFVVFA